uniref:CCHC-type domain-containing protein n=1 Tax=Chenopodium quinoa TaxID=63459 RepID=A0A803N9Y7_CHEQI
MGMKGSEGVKEYGSRLMSIANQIKLVGGEFDNQRVVDKLLVSLPERYETKLSSIEDTKDFSKLTVSELINSLHAVDQRRSMRNENDENKSEKAFLTRSPYQKGKGKSLQCNSCHKIGHEEKDCWHKGKPKCFNCQKFGHLAKNCKSKNEEQETMAQVAVEETLF